MIFRKSKSYPFLFEGASILFLLGIHYLCLRYLQRFELYGNHGIRWLPLLISPLPFLFLYFLLRNFLGPLPLTVLVSGLETLLSVGHAVKVSYLYEALSWGDVSQVTNLPIVRQYLSLWHYLLVAAILLGFVITFRLEKKSKKISHPARVSFWVLALVFFPAIFFYQIVQALSLKHPGLKKIAIERDILHSPNDLVKDARLKGLAYHLIGSSFLRLPVHPNGEQRNLFLKLANQNLSHFNRPKKIIYILCESCWHDSQNFSDIFTPLRERGFKELRAISPAYGGYTSNAAFEMLTGLPSKTDSLDGVIYLKYASAMEKRAHAFPSYLLKHGFKTVAIHNFDKHFWNRHIVNPKLGFQKFIGLQDMNYHGPYWPPDSILYDHAWDVFKENQDSPLFLYLTTVYSHGPYINQNDLGANDYRERVKKSIEDLSVFLDKVLEKEPETLILLYGDHKPSLSDFYVKKGILSANNLERNFPWDPIGDVPLYVRASEPEKVERVIKTSSGLPFFCVAKALDREFIQSGVPAFKFAEDNKLCSDYGKKGYAFYRSAYPDWLYASSLFDDGLEHAIQPLHSSPDF